MKALVDAIPQAASSPRALVAYALLLLALGLHAWRALRYNSILHSLDKVDPRERGGLVQAALGEPVPPSMTPEQFISHRRQQNTWMLLLGVLAVVALGLVLGVFQRRPEATVEAPALQPASDSDATRAPTRNMETQQSGATNVAIETMIGDLNIDLSSRKSSDQGKQKAESR